MPAPVLATFAFRSEPAPFRIDAMRAVRGAALAPAAYLAVHESTTTHALAPGAPEPLYVLRGSTGNLRYTKNDEKLALAKIPPVLGRAEATRASVIPIRKSEAWWDLPQDERRAILEERSRHITIGLDYVAAIARRLYHSRELGEPFDFVTWFEYAPADADRFAELLAALRASEEWKYVEREVQVDLTRA